MAELLTPIAQLVGGVQRSDRGEEAAAMVDLKESLGPLKDAIEPAFDNLFPEVLPTVNRAWANFARDSALPRSAAAPPDWGLVTREDRAFAPAVLIAKFFSVALGNLHTAAFPDVGPEQIHRARARVQTRVESDHAGREFIVVRVLDNGPSFPEPASRRAGRRKGLESIAKMIEVFDGELRPPHRDGDETVVELRMRRYK